MRGFVVFVISSVLLAGQARAQEISVPSVTTASPGGYANPLQLDTDRYRRRQDARRPVQRRVAACSADAMPAADKRRIQAEYMRISRSEGRLAAERYARQQGLEFRQKLVAQGVCLPLNGTSANRTATTANTATRNKNRGKCTRTVMQARNIANPGGGAMSMIMVPVCVN